MENTEKQKQCIPDVCHSKQNNLKISYIEKVPRYLKLLLIK